MLLVIWILVVFSVLAWPPCVSANAAVQFFLFHRLHLIVWNWRSESDTVCNDYMKYSASLLRRLSSTQHCTVVFSWSSVTQQLTLSRSVNRPTPGSVNEYQLRLGRQRQVWFIPLADERGVTRAISERLRGVITTRRYIQIQVYLYLYLYWSSTHVQAAHRTTERSGGDLAGGHAAKLTLDLPPSVCGTSRTTVMVAGRALWPVAGPLVQ